MNHDQNKDYTINIPKGGLYKVGERLTFPTGGLDGQKFTVKKGRGDIQAISITVGDATLDDLSKTTFTLSYSGASFIETDTLVRWSQFYRNDNIIIIPIIIKAGATVEVLSDNQGANDIEICIEQYLYNPNQPSLLN